MVTVYVNDEKIDTGSSNLKELLDQIGFRGIPVLAEVNGAVKLPKEYTATPLSSGDKIELVRMMAGG